ncbi:trypsin-like peptidase domain-containing protein [Fluoribacter gormanii]|uniref:DegP2 peptidase. Serine peptidase. MEROPS family S01B n=1 Tax=Fluoribacter gormanii TaxID=464 RepID=A0A377GHY1_9GAMM|nr:trypsin-like peptidase domain-containing protein [Fluoribacter gormanii]KTD02140.1 DegP protease (Do-like, S2-serine-like) [Fluoribacter gormanii]MCW8444325.1 trypsin-like peptidase domain-containing protein [Fluoribacter gormanii]MCW8469516.1 trypsin-like peptidase domain-containing protein [Fluoribacter gormanii]SIR51109.1 DegP2 peptidase. Serine peptidase. MEROPS family S01B [Fluoribacter gormanii]STO24155.1 Putative serine protease HtrA [Fluoribacter gormanii]
MAKHRYLWFMTFMLCSILALPGHSASVNSLLPDEQNTVQVFHDAAPKVVYVHRLATITNRSLQKKQVSDGAGSGIVWNNSGYIVTNYHVIKGADKLAITLGNLTVPAKVVGAEPRKDIAVLKIESPQALALLKEFKPFEVVHLHELMVGQKAIAIGNPFGLDHSLSKGVISALGRKVPGIGGVTIRNMIQTDTPINPGNSGGPLLNSAGQLIGMNTMIYSNSGSSAGIGFAVPADDIDRIVSQIIKNGRVVLSGIGIQSVPPNVARQLGIRKGILIADVLHNTPADKAHLRGTHRDAWGRIELGDIIVALNGHAVPNYDVLYNMLTEIKVGEQITVSIQRGNKQMDVKMRTIDIAGI